MALKQYQQLAEQLIEDDKGLHSDYEKYENMVHGRWELPGDLRDVPGIHKVVITDPYDALNTMRRILAKQLPRVKIHPLAPNLETKRVTDMWEKGLTWLYDHTSDRRGIDLTSDLAWSAGLYGQIVGQVSYIPHEIKSRQAFKGDTGRLEQVLHDGPFIVELHNPKFTHVLRSSYGVEGVLTKKFMRASEALSFWGERADQLKAKLTKMSDVEKYKATVTQYDWWNDKHRCTWILVNNPSTVISGPSDDGAITIFDEDHGLEFFPWFARITGTGFEHDVRYKINPMLKPVVDTGLYETANALETMIMSKAIKLFGRPSLKEEGLNPAEAQINYSPDNMGEILKAPPGNQVGELRQDVLDQALLAMADREAARMDKSTVSRLLQTGEFPSGMAASAINIVTQSAVESIGPHKRLAEQAIEDIIRLNLLWIHKDGVPLVIDGAAGMNEPQVIIDPNDINPNAIYVDVELTAVAPTDQVARANAGNMMAQMGYPMERVFEQMGETDPQQAMKEARREQFMAAMHREKLADIELRIQAKQAQLQLQVQQQQAQMQQVGQTPPTGAEGQGFNPAAGGNSAVPASGATFEQQMGATRNGQGLPI